ncbi:hypothetical protein R1flu_010066 [Riccia fluitans]|uniref:Uncharacterized protein n=1 Tax=Riccia fluitans TaxID=41844 RepID=A0ABD1Z3Y4_9MARC
MAATSSAKLGMQWVSLKSAAAVSGSPSGARNNSQAVVRCLPSSNLKRRCFLGSVGCGSRRSRDLQVVCAKKGAKERDGGVAEAVESVPRETASVGSSEADDMWMGKKLEGLEPDFWEGEAWDGFGFFLQYLWALGVLISLVACGVAVRTYNTGAADFKDTAVFKEAMDSQVEMDSSVFDQAETQAFSEPGQAPKPFWFLRSFRGGCISVPRGEGSTYRNTTEKIPLPR